MRGFTCAAIAALVITAIITMAVIGTKVFLSIFVAGIIFATVCGLVDLK
jgi:hypothetical protein